MLEILDQSTARKTRHQSKGTNKQASQTAREDPGMQVQLAKQNRPKTQRGKQTNKDNTRGERDREGRERGGDAPPSTEPKDREGETKEEKEHNQREEREQTKQNKGGVRH